MPLTIREKPQHLCSNVMIPPMFQLQQLNAIDTISSGMPLKWNGYWVLVREFNIVQYRSISFNRFHLWNLQTSQPFYFTRTMTMEIIKENSDFIYLHLISQNRDKISPTPILHVTCIIMPCLCARYLPQDVCSLQPHVHLVETVNRYFRYLSITFTIWRFLKIYKPQ